MTRSLTDTNWRRIREMVKKRDKMICQYGGEYAPDGEVDHILPLSKGGSDTFDNLVWCCPKCNREKQGKTLREWVQSLLDSKELARQAALIEERKAHYHPLNDFSSAAWECDCGGEANLWNLEGTTLIPHNHHKENCPLKYHSFISGYFSKIINREPFVYGSNVYLDDLRPKDSDVPGIDYGISRGEFIWRGEFSNDREQELMEEIRSVLPPITKVCHYCGRADWPGREVCPFCGSSAWIECGK